MTRSSRWWLAAVAGTPFIAALCAAFLGWLADQAQWWWLAGVAAVFVVVTFIVGSPAVTSASPGLARAYFVAAGSVSALGAVLALGAVVVFVVAAVTSSGSDGFADLARVLAVILSVLGALVAGGAVLGAVGAFRLAGRLGRGEY